MIGGDCKMHGSYCPTLSKRDIQRIDVLWRLDDRATHSIKQGKIHVWDKDTVELSGDFNLKALQVLVRTLEALQEEE